ncbi:MAG: Radical protein [Acidobacteriota bacterium]|nr:Radical protein [Acidobacteriota bacterium]
MLEETMEITELTFIVTDDCNYNCSYCLQKKEKKTISNGTIRAAVDFFYPFMDRKHRIEIGFWGEEPLLAFYKIKYAYSYNRKKIGSLIRPSFFP